MKEIIKISDKEMLFREFQEALKKATKAMEEYYFTIAMTNLKGHRFRERVYCYELYHQLRLALTEFPYTLQGEMDRNGHPIISKKIGARKPDFILHEPKTMNNNFVVMEVKPLNNTNGYQLKKDLDTLIRFLDLGYYRAIHLIYGSLDRYDRGFSKVIRAYREYMNRSRLNAYNDKLLLYWHRAWGEMAKVIRLEKGIIKVL
jgi:hypothetical protein